MSASNRNGNNKLTPSSSAARGPTHAPPAHAAHMLQKQSTRAPEHQTSVVLYHALPPLALAIEELERVHAPHIPLPRHETPLHSLASLPRVSRQPGRKKESFVFVSSRTEEGPRMTSKAEELTPDRSVRHASAARSQQSPSWPWTKSCGVVPPEKSLPQRVGM